MHISFRTGLSSVLLALLGTASLQPAHAQLTLTPEGTALGFNLSTFATGFPHNSSIGPAGIVFPTTGGVLVADNPGNVRLFSTDTDGQTAASAPVGQNYGQGNAFGLAQVGSNIYMTQPGKNDIVQINPDGTFDQMIVSVPKPATGIVANPANGHLFVDYGGSGTGIVTVDPLAKTETPFVKGLSVDGLSVSNNGEILYGAVYGGNLDGHVIGFDINTGAQIYDSGFIADGIDGIASGNGNLDGNLFVNTNGGTVVELDLATRAQTLIAHNGSRGDFVTVDPTNGSLLLTQSQDIVRLTATPGGGFGAVPEASSVVSLGLLLLLGAGGVAVSRRCRAVC